VSHHEAGRVAFWIEYMDRSYALAALAQEIIRYPLQKNCEPFANIQDAMEAAGVEVRYSTTKIGGQFERNFQIRESLIPDMTPIARDMNARRWILRIEDGYRTAAMQIALGRARVVFAHIIRSCNRECGGARPPVDLVFHRAMCPPPARTCAARPSTSRYTGAMTAARYGAASLFAL
jgi:D-alanyl-D-alanine dipeptidase